MNHGVSSSSATEVFLVKYADCKCLAVRGANRRWKSFYNDIELLGAVEPIASIPFELILPFLPGIKHEQLCRVPAHSKTNPD